MAPIRIDGNTLEGGGQVLRVAAVCAVLQGRAVTVYNIRAGRSKPGLKAQHLTGLELLTSMSGGRLQGGNMNSMEVTLTPGQIKPGDYRADTHTAGSVMLLLQAVLPCCLYARGTSTLVLRGGTNADMAPQADFTGNVFRRVAANFGVTFSMDITTRGFFPRGGGEVRTRVEALQQPLRAVQLVKRGTLTAVRGISYVAGYPPRLATAVAAAAATQLKTQLNIGPEVQVDITKEVVPPSQVTGKSFGLVLWAETSTGVVLGGAGLSGRDSRADDLGREAARGLADTVLSGACVDPHMQDQVVLLMGLAAGRSTVLCGPLTLHTKTAMAIMEEMTEAKFTTAEEGSLVRITCDGIGLDPNNMPEAT